MFSEFRVIGRYFIQQVGRLPDIDIQRPVRINGSDSDAESFEEQRPGRGYRWPDREMDGLPQRHRH